MMDCIPEWRKQRKGTKWDSGIRVTVLTCDFFNVFQRFQSFLIKHSKQLQLTEGDALVLTCDLDPSEGIGIHWHSKSELELTIPRVLEKFNVSLSCLCGQCILYYRWLIDNKKGSSMSSIDGTREEKNGFTLGTSLAG